MIKILDMVWIYVAAGFIKSFRIIKKPVLYDAVLKEMPC
jgi:hypothetical protein